MSANPITLAEYADRMRPLIERELNSDLIDQIRAMEDLLALYGPRKRTPWWKRVLSRCGDTLIRCGVALGGDVEDFR